MLLTLLVLHALAAFVAAVAPRRLGQRVFFVAGLAPLAAFAASMSAAPDVLAGKPVVEELAWVEALGLTIDLRLDAFALLMTILVSGIGTLIFFFAAWYFSPKPGLKRFASSLVAFSGAMLGLVLSDHLLLVYVFWELTSVTSYLLIGFDDENGAARSAALQALLVTGSGGLVMLAGLVLLGQQGGTYRLAELLENPPSGTLVSVALALILVGAATKSAQVPFHFWLPGAMAAPTPASAYLHSATMVKAGVYLIARLSPAFAPVVGWWRPVVVMLGVATMVVGGYRALRQYDLKLLLAYGTVSQLGFMVALFGAGRPELTAAGTVLLLAHGFFKAALFMVVGVIDHQAKSRDLRRLTGIGRRMPVVAVAAVLATASMAGVPPLLGFISKEAAYEALLHADLGAIAGIAAAGVVVGSVLTFAYGARFLWGALGDKPRRGLAEQVDATRVAVPSPAFVAPAFALAGLGLLAGLVPAVVSSVVIEAAHVLDHRVEVHNLARWHGLNIELALSALTIALGLGLFVSRRRVELLQDRLEIAPAAASGYSWSLRSLLRGADRVTGVVQNGSLPVYLGVILITALVLPATSLVRTLDIREDAVFSENWLQVFTATAVIAASVVVATATRRFVGVLFLGAVGYGVAVLFVIHGAPDLALTQVLIETLSLVVYVLVLRHLPERFDRVRHPLSAGLRAGVAGAVGLFVGVFALAAAAGRTAEPISKEFLARSLPEGGGRNVVNVIIVDFRGFDTFGEITVLAVAALGVASLVLAGRARRSP